VVGGEGRETVEDPLSKRPVVEGMDMKGRNAVVEEDM
jgi:hypothetical protein